MSVGWTKSHRRRLTTAVVCVKELPHRAMLSNFFLWTERLPCCFCFASTHVRNL